VAPSARRASGRGWDEGSKRAEAWPSPTTGSQRGRSPHGVARPPAGRTTRPAVHRRAARPSAEGRGLGVRGPAHNVFAPREATNGRLRDDPDHYEYAAQMIVQDDAEAASPEKRADLSDELGYAEEFAQCGAGIEEIFWQGASELDTGLRVSGKGGERTLRGPEPRGCEGGPTRRGFRGEWSARSQSPGPHRLRRWRYRRRWKHRRGADGRGR
jgi:hypothetical protein